MKKICVLISSLVLLCLALSGCGGKIEENGLYRIDVALSGGSGRASVESPALLQVDGETMTATIVWGSPYYEYMLVDDVRCEPIQTEGNSTFVIPVVLDTDMKVSACTIAMSEPHVIEYTLHFDSATAEEA